MLPSSTGQYRMQQLVIHGRMAGDKGRPMTKRLAVMAAAIAVVALALSVVVPAAADDEGRHRIRVVAVLAEQQELNLGPQGFSLGDQFILSENLWRHGKKVGRSGVECTVTSVKNEEVQCTGTVRLGNGQITARGLLGQARSFTIPVSGGSGAYFGAEGVLHIRQVSERKEIYTFVLEN